MEETSLDISETSRLNEESQEARGQRTHVAGVDIEARCADDEVLWVRSLEDQQAARLKGAHRQIDQLDHPINRHVLNEMEGCYGGERSFGDSCKVLASIS
jgi:hypothetical protein